MSYSEEDDEDLLDRPYTGNYSEPIVKIKRLWNHHNTAFAFLVGVLCVIGFTVSMYYFGLDVKSSIILGAVILVCYSILLFFLLEPGILKEITRREVEYRRVPGPVREVARKVYVAEYNPKLNIPKYAFVGSDETKTFHKRGCRFSKLIKNKFKVSSNSLAFFKGRKFRECEACFPKKRKKR